VVLVIVTANNDNVHRNEKSKVLTNLAESRAHTADPSTHFLGIHIIYKLYDHHYLPQSTLASLWALAILAVYVS